MSSLRHTFEQYADVRTVGSITSGTTWSRLIETLESSGNILPSGRRALVELETKGRFEQLAAGVTLKDVLISVAAANDISSSVNRSTTDVQHDVAALKRFATYIIDHFDSESSQRAGLQRSLDDVADEFRGALVCLLRLAAVQIDHVDACRRQALLVIDPDSQSLSNQARNPFTFQRQHSRAIQRRVAAVHVSAQFVAVDHRLFPRPPPRAIVAGSELLQLGSGGAVIGPSSDIDPKRATGVDVWLARRTDRPAAELAAVGVPTELEVVRLPLLGSLDPSGTAAATFSALDGAAICVDASGRGSLSLLGSACPGVLMTIPAPSALLHRPRSHASSLELAFAEQDALTQLTLSQYFQDTCGVHDVLGGNTGSTADERCSILAGASALLGPTAMLLREHIPAAVPLGQLRAMCGPLHESQPLFRHIARELLSALADLDSQCFYDVARIAVADVAAAKGAAAITIEHVYLSESGTRLTLRGIPWAEPLEEGVGGDSGHGSGCSPLSAFGGQAALQSRSRALLQAYGCILLALLPPHKGTSASESPRFISRQLAEAGFSVAVGDTVLVELAATEAEVRATTLSATNAAHLHAGGVQWLTPVVQTLMPTQQRGVARDGSRREASNACVEVAVSPQPSTTLAASSPAGKSTTSTMLGAVSRFEVRALQPGSASLLCKLVQSGHLPLVGGGGGGGEPAMFGGPGTVVLVPVTVHAAGTSPTLSAILETATPQPAASPLAEIMRWLSASVQPRPDEQQITPGGAFLRTVGLLAAILNPVAAQGAADLAAQSGTAGGSSTAAVPSLLLHDLLVAISSAPGVLHAPTASADAMSLAQLAAHPYFSIERLVRDQSAASTLTDRDDADVDLEAQWQRSVIDNYAAYSFALLHSC